MQFPLETFAGENNCFSWKSNFIHNSSVKIVLRELLTFEFRIWEIRMCFYPPLTGALSHTFLIFHRFSFCWGILNLTSCRRHSKWEMFVNYHVDFHYQTCREYDNFIENSTISRWKIKKKRMRERENFHRSIAASHLRGFSSSSHRQRN